MSGEEKQYEKINFTFPVAIEWIIEEEQIPFKSPYPYMDTKIYRVPGFPWLKYSTSFHTMLQPENFLIHFCRFGLEEKTCEWESNLSLRINNGEPKKVFKKFKEEDLLLYEGPIEEFNNSKKCISDPITLLLNGTITVHEISRPDDHYAYISSGYNLFRELQEPKDFIIEVENQEIQVHKKVLQLCSPVFSAMFENGWKEAIEGRVVIPEFPFEIVETVIKLCYGKAIYYETENLELILLYRFADKYDMDEIKHTIKEIIFLTPNNICEYANLFYTENCPIFVNHCIDRLIVYFQFSYSVKDLETLDTDIKNHFFYQASVSQAMKKEFNPGYYKNRNNEDLKDALLLL